ncbi:hypothetical protein quinque_003640 [Culex quinquefasciatus]
MVAPTVWIVPGTASPNQSQMSLDAAPADLTKWELIPYRFNSPALPHDFSDMDLTTLGSIRMPEYHQLVDHTLGVVWKCFSNGKRDVKKLLPDQILWALKMARAHQGEQSHFSEGVQLLIQYFEEILLSICAGGVQKTPRKTSSRKSIELIDSSFVLTNLEQHSNLLAPTAASTPLPAAARSGGPSPMASRPGSAPALGPISGRADPPAGLLHQMLIRLRKDGTAPNGRGLRSSWRTWT